MTSARTLMQQRSTLVSTNLERWYEAEHVVAPVAAVAQQHLLGVAAASAHAAAGLEDGLVPGDGALQRGEVEEDLGEAGAGHQRLLPALTARLTRLLLCERREIQWNHDYRHFMEDNFDCCVHGCMSACVLRGGGGGI